ncbi:hypothetical protein B0I37DRAFT_403722 [Chaetomium sp. MPI-CAGE-AT-0009]|nr:hypothetical protein B0I37DRAFT_403722 [Chaetomium sp. MPI-CAGE-AT-0009]
MSGSGTQGGGGAVRRRPRPAAGPDEAALYFTYGSNLHLAQMAERCPASRYVGKGKLTSYRWQINQRGVANVVKTGNKEDVVRGLIFEVTLADVRALDRFEGVRSGAYSRETLEVTVTPNDAYARKKTSEVAARVEAYHESHAHGSTLAGRGTIPDVKLPALVYVSKNHMLDGTIRDEYIPRMANAVADAKALGVSRTYIRDVMAPHLGDPNAGPGTPQPGPPLPVSEPQSRPGGGTSVATDIPGVRQPGPVQVARRNGANIQLVEPNTGPRRPAGATERRSAGANIQLVEPSQPIMGRRTPRTEREARELAHQREAREIQAEMRERGPYRWRTIQNESGESENQNGNERPANGGGEPASTSATSSSSTAAPKRSGATTENGNAPKPTANGEGNGTTATANASAATPKRSAAKAESGGAQKATANGEGNGTATAANGSAAAPKRSAAKTESGGAPKPTANGEGSGTTAPANASAAAPKRTAANASKSTAATTKTDNGGAAAAANGTTPTPKKAAAKPDANGTSAANGTGNGTGNGPGNGTGTGATKKANTKTENTAAQS